MRAWTSGGAMALGLALGASAFGCGGDDETTGSSSGGTGGAVTGGGGAGTGGGGTGATGGTGGTGGGTDGGGSGGTGGTAGAAGGGGAAGTPGTPPYDLHAADRKACAFTSGSKTTESIGPDVPHGDALPFQHIVVLMQENRSFDHYFSNLPAFGVTDADVATPQATNPDPDDGGALVARFHETRYCTADVNHDWEGVHQQYDDGKVDGFVATNNPGGARAMGYYTEQDLPYYYWMAKTFAMSDRHFCSLLGPTWPNRFYFFGATSWGVTSTGDIGFLTSNAYQNSQLLPEMLTQAGRSFKIYRDGLTSFALLFGVSYLGSGMGTFDSDVDNDTLPDLAIIDPSFNGSGQNDEHPPSNVQLGQQFTARVLDKLMSNPDVWKKTVFIWLYDEHGGYYDHVPPPEACEPDGELPPSYKFDRLGFRTPLVVASPFVKAGYVSHLDTDITSVTRFIENRFDLPAMTARDANAWPMLDMFDFASPPAASPTTAPDATPDPAGIDWCQNNPPGTGKP